MLLGTSKACPDRKGSEPTSKKKKKENKKRKEEEKKKEENRNKNTQCENRKKGESKLRLIEKPANLHRVGHDW